MCGIFGYIGKNTNAAEIALKGLKKLEYRGYDSWGMGCKTDHKIKITKKLGKISDTKKSKSKAESNIAIAHTRWATHGEVTLNNCHPHTSENSEVVVVQNGVIENYEELRKELIKEGHIFTSETDTEVLPHLIEKYLHFGFEKATSKALARLEGRFAFLIIAKDYSKMIAARRDSPLIIGKGDDEYFIASDTLPFMEYTQDVMYLDDDEYVIIDKEENPKFYHIQTNKPVKKRVVHINWEMRGADKGDYKHFMLKEIMDQKNTIQRAINQDEKELTKIANILKKAKGTFFVGCGTTDKVSKAGEYFFAKIAHKHVNSVVASEFSSYKNFLTDKTLMTVISQSGETADVLEAMKVAQKKGVHILSLVNTEGSSIMRQSDSTFLINAGPEQAVASTKAATSQMALLILLAYASIDKLKKGKKLLIETASKINDMLNPRYLEHIKAIAKKIHKQDDIFIIGKEANYPMALETAIKIQEVSYIHAQGFTAGEIKHGPIAMIQKKVPCIAFVPMDDTRAEILSNTMQLKARGAHIIGISPRNNEAFDNWIKVPDCGEASAIVNIIPAQILSYFLAVLRGKDPDKPRNLAKSVTVK